MLPSPAKSRLAIQSLQLDSTRSQTGPGTISLSASDTEIRRGVPLATSPAGELWGHHEEGLVSPSPSCAARWGPLGATGILQVPSCLQQRRCRGHRVPHCTPGGLWPLQPV